MGDKLNWAELFTWTHLFVGLVGEERDSLEKRKQMNHNFQKLEAKLILLDLLNCTYPQYV
jgi:hypothetical protein